MQEGTTCYVFWRKLKNLKQKFIDWRKNTFGDFENKIRIELAWIEEWDKKVGTMGLDIGEVVERKMAKDKLID